MEYCENGGLFDFLQNSTIQKKCFLKWLNEISSGMHYLHTLKIVHRDLKSPKCFCAFY